MEPIFIPGGYILQPRKLDESEIMKAPPIVREVWQYLCRKVNHKDSKDYKRGSNFFCLSDIQNDLSWFVGYRKMKYSKPQLTKTLRRLCEAHAIETAKATRGLYITIPNYDKYQTASNYEGNGEGNTKETRRKREGHTKNKNDKNERMKEVNINTLSSEPQATHELEEENFILSIPLITKSENGSPVNFKITQEHFDQLKDSFPGVDTLLALKDIRQWNIDNPTRRKTETGIKSHISAWISKAQDKGKYKKNGVQGNVRPFSTSKAQAEMDQTVGALNRFLNRERG